MSQYFANFYLSKFDHWIKETKRIKDYFRYMDDIVILGNNKDELRDLFNEIVVYLKDNLKLEVKSNYQIFPVSRGIDFVGYVHYPTHTLLRKSIKQRMKRKLHLNPNYDTKNYYGWTKHTNCRNLERKYKINPYECKNKEIRVQQAL